MEPVKGGILSPTEAATGHLHVVNDLDDVETDGAQEGDALVFTGFAWVPGEVAAGVVSDEVNVRPDQPPDTVELWVDTDDVPPVAFALGKVALANGGAFADATSFPSAATDVPGLSCTWVADPSRLYKITATGQTDQLTNSAQQTMYITDGANAVQMSGSYAATAGLGYTWWSVPYTESGLTGSVTRKVRMAATSVTGRMRTPTSWRLIVEDIGLA